MFRPCPIHAVVVSTLPDHAAVFARRARVATAVTSPERDRDRHLAVDVVPWLSAIV